MPNSSPKRPRYLGKLQGLSGDLAYGWAWDRTHPDNPLVIEILADDYPIGLVSARLFSKHLSDARIGDGRHAFGFRVPAHFHGSGARITARIANTAAIIPGLFTMSGERGEVHTTNCPVDGELVVADGGLMVHGWASDPAREDSQTSIRSFYRDRELCSVQTDSNNRFAMVLPAEFADGKVRRVRVTANGRELPGSPLSICTHLQGPRHLLSQLLTKIGDGVPLDSLNADTELLNRIIHDYEVRQPQGLSFNDYDTWFHAFETPSPNVRNIECSILILIGKGKHIAATLDSLYAQTHRNWKGMVVGSDAAEFAPESRNLLFTDQTEIELDPKICANFDLVTFIEPGDHLPRHALATVAQAFERPEVHALYTDCDHDGLRGERTNPWFKPAWDFEHFQGIDYAHNLFVARIRHVRGQRLERLNDLPYLAVISLLSENPKEHIHHLPRILYHKRNRSSISVKAGARRRQSVAKLLGVLYPDNPPQVLPHPLGLPELRRIHHKLKNNPSVSIVIPTRDRLDLLEQCVESFLQHTKYRDFELVIVDNQSRDPSTLTFLAAIEAREQVRVLHYDKDFNYSAINNFAAAQSTSDVLCLLNNDTLLPKTSGDWLSIMLGHLLSSNVGAVGTKLLWRNHVVQHAGVVLGIGGIAGHVGNTWQNTDAGYFNCNLLPRCYSAITAACLVTRRHDYIAAGGLDEKCFPVSFNDVDYCLKLRAKEMNIVWTPYAPIYHLESQSRGADHEIPEKLARSRMEIANLQRHWHAILNSDPSYNPNLSLAARQPPFTGLAIPPRDQSLR